MTWKWCIATWPSNIGIIGTPPCCILLDTGTTAHLQLCMLQPTPGQVGTFNYLALELEIESYGAPADIWAMAVILYELTYAQHLWRYLINPWRGGKENIELRQINDEIQEKPPSGVYLSMHSKFWASKVKPHSDVGAMCREPPLSSNRPTLHHWRQRSGTRAFVYAMFNRLRCATTWGFSGEAMVVLRCGGMGAGQSRWTFLLIKT